MAVRFILMMALMMVGSADPVPDESIQIDVKQIVNAGAGCGGGCCDDGCDNKGCTFDDERDESLLNYENKCIKVCCKMGVCTYKIKPDCGECIVAAEPWVKTFNPVKGQYVNPEYPGNWYRTNKPDSTTNNPVEYILTKKERTTKTPNVGVNGNFYYATGWPGNHGNGSYVNNIIYTEDSGSKTVEWSCYPGDGTNLARPCTTFDLKYDGKLIKESALPYSENGIWIFKVDTTLNPGNCIIIAGNFGLTVMVCMEVKTLISPAVDIYLPYVYIYASPTSSASLKNNLYGICNTFTGTGETLKEYIGRFTTYPEETCALSSNDWIIEKECSGFMDNWQE